MRKGMFAGLMLAVALSVMPAAFAATCPGNPQGPGDEPWVFTAKGSYLGVDVSDVTADRVGALKLKEETGVEVTAVDSDSPAGKAGVKEHDVILTLNGARMESQEQLRRVVREMPAGRTVTLGISRDGQPVTLKAALADRRTAVKVATKIRRMPAPHAMPGDVPMPPMPPDMDFDFPTVIVQRTTRVGLMVESLTPQLAEFFGVKDGSGLLIRSVEKGTPAEAAGFKAGDVIVRLDKEKIGDVGDWARLTRGRSGDVSVGIVRDKREQNVTVKLPERKKDQSMLMTPDSDFDFDFEFDADELQGQLKKLQPEIERQSKQIAVIARDFAKQHEAEIAQAQKAAKKAMEEQRKALEQMQKDLKNLRDISLEY